MAILQQIPQVYPLNIPPPRPRMPRPQGQTGGVMDQGGKPGAPSGMPGGGGSGLMGQIMGLFGGHGPAPSAGAIPGMSSIMGGGGAVTGGASGAAAGAGGGLGALSLPELAQALASLGMFL